LTKDANDLLLGSGAKSVSFKEKGSKVSGVVESFDVIPVLDIQSKKPTFWDDGSPKEQVRIILMTDERDDEDDDGRRAVYVKSGMLKAVQAALREAKAKLAKGGRLAIKYVKDGEAKTKGFNPPKIYVAKYEAPDPATVAANEAAEAGESKDDAEDFDF